MTTYTLFRLSDRQAQKELATQRRYMQRHRAELADTRNPDALRRYMEFNRLSIICASPPGCWHKSNGSRYTSPQNRLYPPPGEPGTVYGQLITTKTGPVRPAQWAPPPGIRPHGSPQRHNATPGQL